MHSEGINAGEMKHGPLALVDDKLPIVVVSTMDTMHSKMAGVIQQVRRVRCVRVLAVPCCGCKAHTGRTPGPSTCPTKPTAGWLCLQLMARNGRLIVIANEEDDEMVDIVNGKYPIIQVG